MLLLNQYKGQILPKKVGAHAPAYPFFSPLLSALVPAWISCFLAVPLALRPTLP